MSIVSARTIGLIASKNARCWRPTNAAMSADSADDVSGPVATMSGDISTEVGSRGISPRSTPISGCPAIARVTPSANCSRSTASAAPAGTRTPSATRITSDPSRRISSLSSPTALSSLSPRNELLQTSSASRSVLWTAVATTGRISWSVTGTPIEAACQAASLPASPPPMMWTIGEIVIRQALGVGHWALARALGVGYCRAPPPAASATARIATSSTRLSRAT